MLVNISFCVLCKKLNFKLFAKKHYKYSNLSGLRKNVLSILVIFNDNIYSDEFMPPSNL